ncbi:restriction endonuclease [Streptomyces jumonjinensis]|uniref:Restriction endonuclease n=1 Tax=Streptomyces jumonjinensis TaxID=1945 RepID=A0A646KGZ0_STRJU|nr:restriction endonuclease [Streptomyces jumonjinensis]MQT01331.1 restriction endonuclease [Streptomyces jumonjinensis]
MARRRPWPRRPRGAAEVLAAGVVALAMAVAAVQLITAAAHTLLDYWPLTLPAALLALSAPVRRIARFAAVRRRRARRLAQLRITLAQFDAMDDQEFEYALRDLLIRDGWPARKVGRGGDQAADVIGEHTRRGRIVVQAKLTRVGGKVTSSVMYVVNGTAGPVHGADHAVVITNGAFTRSAMAWGDQYGVHWVDRDRLRRWAEDGTALDELLRLPPRPRRVSGRLRGPGRTAGSPLDRAP